MLFWVLVSFNVCLSVFMIPSWWAQLERLVLPPRVGIDLWIDPLRPSSLSSPGVRTTQRRRTNASKVTNTEASGWLSPVTTTLTSVRELNCINVVEFCDADYTLVHFFLFNSIVLVGRATPKVKPPAQKTCSAAKKDRYDKSSHEAFVLF